MEPMASSQGNEDKYSFAKHGDYTL